MTIMKILQRLVGLMVLIALLSVSLALLGGAFSVEWQEYLVSFTQHGLMLDVWTGIGLLCLAVLFALTGIRRKKREHFLSFDNEGSTVSISTDAIADYITKLADEFPSIIRMRPRVIPARNAVDIIVDVRIKAGPQIHEVCGLLQQRIRESMTNGLGISEIRRIEVSVREIISEHRPV